MAKLTDAKGKTVVLSVETENEQLENTVATHPVENGSPITDHAQMESKTFEFSGKIIGKNQSEVDDKYMQLLTWFHQSTLLQFRGAIRHNNMLISHLEKTYDEGGYKNAVKFNISLIAIYTVNVYWKKAKNSGKKQAKPSGAVYVTVRPGNTYWGWWVKYGTPIQTLRNWNHWPDRRIPIGVRARVK
ncbi:LysM peptidoglycan-binding domain-containing protein [Weissella sagaensis]|uniref:LysM peptidoglycan-binding domain-containing protein n=1 Tax=Weissella sagaensis TaxID=2559928 RepID=A0ABW1RS45_9LACO|nr:LysM peptidoglycan-binding domain-containing protein [Weissella sagaensis]QDJ58122.1 LysM peptidoglycan-binding domain-containing protein [Weissella hellenica]UEG66232.1 LysM peptidoglycan-binding domain-containing protein [Weissella hellenica]